MYNSAPHQQKIYKYFKNDSNFENIKKLIWEKQGPQGLQQLSSLK